jgi:hypothetical protein
MFHQLFLLFRIIVIEEGKAIKIKIFGITLKKREIEKIRYTNKPYGVGMLRRILLYNRRHPAKYIFVNEKYFACITRYDGKKYFTV